MKRLRALIFMAMIALPIHAAYSSGDHKEHEEKDAIHLDEHDKHEESKEHDERDDHREESSKFGEGKAILEVKNDGEKFRLSEKAEHVMGIKLTTIIKQKDQDRFQIPLAALVEFQSEQGVYIKKDNWYKLVDIKILKSQNQNLVIEAHDILPSDKIVTSGVSLLRIAHLEASGQGGQGHAH